MRAVVDRDGARRADLAAIHIAKARLRWDDGTYRDVLFSVCRVKSSAQLDFTGRKRFLAHLQACVRQMAPSLAPSPVRRATARNPTPLKPTQAKMWSLWMELADAEKVEHRTMAALTAFAKRQTGVDHLDWLNGRQEDLVIESLKAWLARDEAKT